MAYTKRELYSILQNVKPEMNINKDAYETINFLIKNCIIKKLKDVLEPLQGKLQHQDIIDAFNNILGQEMARICSSEIQKVIRFENPKLEISLVNTVIIFDDANMDICTDITIVLMITSGIEYILTELLEHSGIITRYAKKKFITSTHIMKAINEDDELKHLFN